ncbi:hypothetical protein Tsubulata_040912 [Turnera subulata]|uniref:Anaphase-promoting complex subunit 4 WD40 domain-containing protein n=1 Tax=Turnera subulata TaxID=218843 RepID=A0A9Q0GEN6_9ROSI|nr:hypothetical protein Tsubulata_040912 [Turnera subulata]
MADEGGVYLDESDIIEEFMLDDEVLPDAADDGHSGVDDGEDDADSDVFLLEDPKCDDSVHVFTGHALHDSEPELFAVACNPTNATLVATGGSDNKGFLWRIGQENVAVELCGHKDSVSSLAFSNDGQLLASGGVDATVRIWDMAGNQKHNLRGNPDASGFEYEWVRWHPRGHVVMAGSDHHDCTARMWNADTGVLLHTFYGHTSAVTCGGFTPDGKTICTGSLDGSLRIWNPVSGESVHLVRGNSYHTEGLTCLAIGSDSTLAISGATDGSVHAVNITTGRVVSSLSAHSNTIRCIALASRFPWAATGSKDKKLIVWDLQHSSPRSTCTHEAGVRCLAWLGASSYLATGCSNGEIHLWDGRSGDHIRAFRGHSGSILSLSVSSNEDFLVSVSYDGTARVFNISEFK